MDREFYKKFLKFVKFYMNTFYKIDESGIENIPKDNKEMIYEIIDALTSYYNKLGDDETLGRCFAYMKSNYYLCSKNSKMV